MRNIARSMLAATILAATASFMGMAHAQKIDLGLDGITGPAAPSDERVLVATISKDGAVVKRMPYGNSQGQVIVFDTTKACEDFQQLPFFPEIRASLDEFVAHAFPGATAVVSCEPLD